MSGPAPIAPPDFFISYTAVDRSWAEWVAWTLEEAGYTTLIQAWDFQPGENFVHKMDEATRISRRTIAILSEAYFTSAFASAEWYAAFARAAQTGVITLIPVRIQECEITGLLAQIVYIDLVGLEEEAARQKLVAGVLEKSERPGKPTVKPKFPSATLPRPNFPGPSSAPASTLQPRGIRKGISDDLVLEVDAAQAASERLRRWAFLGFLFALLLLYLALRVQVTVPAGFPPSLLALGALCIAVFVDRPLAALIARSAAVRRLALGRAWLDGFWQIKTYSLGSKDAEATGLVEMSCAGYPLRLGVLITKLKAADTPYPTTSKSDRALLSLNLVYWNKWSYTINGETLNGYASGVFDMKNPEAKHPDNYQGVLVFSDGSPHRVQRASKIPPSRIAEFRTAHGIHWRDALLREMEGSTL